MWIRIYVVVVVGLFSFLGGVVTCLFFTPTEPSYIRSRLRGGRGGKGMNAFVFMNGWQKVHCMRESVCRQKADMPGGIHMLSLSEATDTTALLSPTHRGPIL